MGSTAIPRLLVRWKFPEPHAEKTRDFMEQQVISNFLNSPGILGLGLIEGDSRPYFVGVDQALTFQQKSALSQGIQQVISTTPPAFDSFNFRFAQQDIWIYKLSNGVILLVVAHKQLDNLAYTDAVDQLKKTLTGDPQRTIATFRRLADQHLLTQPTGAANASAEANEPVVPHEPPAPAPIAPDSWSAYITVFNQLTDATTEYLGKIVVANTWRTTCPDQALLNRLQMDRGGHFSLAVEPTAQTSTAISPEERTLIQQWAEKFVQRCSLVIRGYSERVVSQCLNGPQRALLNLETAP